MTFKFHNMDDITRKYMLEEVNYDIEKNNLYYSKRLNRIGRLKYPNLIISMIQNGDEDLFAESILRLNYLKKEDKYTKNGKIKTKNISKSAHKLIAQAEFNRFYMRALCIRAMSEDFKLEIYRAKLSKNPRSDSEKVINKTVNPEILLNSLRFNPDSCLDKLKSNSKSGNGVEYVLLQPNSGLSVRTKK